MYVYHIVHIRNLHGTLGCSYFYDTFSNCKPPCSPPPPRIKVTQKSIEGSQGPHSTQLDTHMATDCAGKPTVLLYPEHCLVSSTTTYVCQTTCSHPSLYWNFFFKAFKTGAEQAVLKALLLPTMQRALSAMLLHCRQHFPNCLVCSKIGTSSILSLHYF